MIKTARELLAGISKDELRALQRYLDAERHLHDPVAWVTERLGESLWSKQREIARAVRAHRLVAVHAAQDVGKTHVGSRLVCWWIDTHPLGEAIAVSTAPTQKQLEAVLWRAIRQAHRQGRLPGALGETEWKVNGEIVALGRHPADYTPEAFQGFHAPFVLVILDEACGIPVSLWDAASTLAANEASRMLAIGNPDDPTSRFASVCAPGSGWHVIRIDGLQSPNFTDEEVPRAVCDQLMSPVWVKEHEASWGEDSPLFTSKVRGCFPKETEDTLIPISWIKAAQARFQTIPEHAETLGVDVARFGSDETVIVARAGESAWVAARHRKEDTMQTTGRVIRAMEDLGAARARVDDIGVGGGVVDRLKEQHKEVTGVNVGAGASDTEHFANARAEYYWGLHDLFERGEISICPDDELAAQLAGIRRSFDSAGRIRIESKQDARSRGVRSPDIADALMLAFSERKEPEISVAVLVEMNRSLKRENPWRI
jgi:hypothetical protein